ncbi:MAG TPA: hypothetical protein VKZ49_17850 [Polyangiaceae bacterium]|nr:hypothetical protein [Polyangiaceae bacterium]
MIDENAFGLLVSYFGIEDDEYSLEPEQFLARCETFRTLVRRLADERWPGDGVHKLDLGHAVYLELAEDDPLEEPVRWLREARSALQGAAIESVCVLSHGGRWVNDGDDDRRPAPGWLQVSCSSEPLRRALYADTAAQIDEDGAPDGWGPGVYIDIDALEALGLKLKNAPTVLASAGATFIRISR